MNTLLGGLRQKTMTDRHRLDFYETHRGLTTALLKRKDLGSPSCILECCSGNRAIADVLSICLPDTMILTNDIDIEREADYYFDATRGFNWQVMARTHPFDWVITNPPFGVASRIIPHAVKTARRGVIFMLRLSWLEPTRDRAEFLRFGHPPLGGLYPINPRPKFRVNKDGKPGTDSVTVAWYIWDKFQDLKTFDLQFITDWKQESDDEKA